MATPLTEPCDLCDGTGLEMPGCEECNGEGRIKIDGEWEDCPECMNQPCPKCHGEGEV